MASEEVSYGTPEGLVTSARVLRHRSFIRRLTLPSRQERHKVKEYDECQYWESVSVGSDRVMSTECSAVK